MARLREKALSVMRCQISTINLKQQRQWTSIVIFRPNKISRPDEVKGVKGNGKGTCEGQITKGFLSLKRQWQMKYGFGVRVVPSQKLAFLQYEFYDDNKNFIDMQEELENT